MLLTLFFSTALGTLTLEGWHSHRHQHPKSDATQDPIGPQVAEEDGAAQEERTGGLCGCDLAHAHLIHSAADSRPAVPNAAARGRLLPLRDGFASATRLRRWPFATGDPSALA